MKEINLGFNKTHYLRVFLLSIIIVLSGCKKEDEEVLTSQPDFQPDFTTTSVLDITPSALQSQGSPLGNIYLQQIDNYMMMPSMYMNFSAGMLQEIQSNAKMGIASPPTWQWSYGGYVINYSYNQTSTQYTFSYSVAMNGSVWYNIDGWQNIDGSGGHWEYTFDYSSITQTGGASSNNWEIVFDWEYIAGVYDFEMEYDFGSYSILIDMNSDTNNGSGFYRYYQPSNTLLHEYIWFNNGNNGSFTSGGQTTTWP
jgi:hypothetical protein